MSLKPQFRDIYGWFSIDWMCLAVSLGFAQHVVQSVSQGLKLHNANLQFLESWLSGIWEIGASGGEGGGGERRCSLIVLW